MDCLGSCDDKVFDKELGVCSITTLKQQSTSYSEASIDKSRTGQGFKGFCFT